MATLAAHQIDDLVDFFLLGNAVFDTKSATDDCSSGFSAEGSVEVPETALEIISKVGQTYKVCGEQFIDAYEKAEHRSLSDDVKDLFKDGDKDTYWPRYQALMDNAARTTGLYDDPRLLGGVLVSAYGLGMLGTGLKNCIQRYIKVKGLDKVLLRVVSRHQALD